MCIIGPSIFSKVTTLSGLGIIFETSLEDEIIEKRE
jgi:hypothetical protein